MHIKYVNRYVANKPSLKICNEMQRSVSFKTEKEKKSYRWRCRGSNPGPFTCKANALPLRYIP